MLVISNSVKIPDTEIDIQAVRSQGAGGQNVNKVSSAVHLRFDVIHSSLPDFYKIKLCALKDQRITKEGVVVIKAQAFRTFEKNKADALQRLIELIRSAVIVRRKRKATRPTRNSKIKRMDSKAKRGKVKALRGKVKY